MSTMTVLLRAYFSQNIGLLCGVALNRLVAALYGRRLVTTYRSQLTSGALSHRRSSALIVPIRRKKGAPQYPTPLPPPFSLSRLVAPRFHLTRSRRAAYRVEDF